MYAIPTGRFLWRLFALYILDWIVILGTIAFAATTSFWATPNTHPFLPTDANNGYPFSHHEAVPTHLLIVLAIVVPAVLILVLALLLPRRSPYVPFTRGALRTFRLGHTWKTRIYALNTSWLGLGLAIAFALLVTDGLKNFIGKPRPDMLDRCGVSTDSAVLDAAAVGPAGLVTWDVCTNRFNNGAGGFSESDVRDGFRSWPSGHSSLSFAGLGYVAVWLGAYVFGIRLPRSMAVRGTDSAAAPLADTRDGGETPLPKFPTMLALLIASVPVLLAMWIASSRYYDYRHHGFDILSGVAIGIASAYVGWRWYGAWSCVDGGWKAARSRDEMGGGDDGGLFARMGLRRRTTPGDVGEEEVRRVEAQMASAEERGSGGSDDPLVAARMRADEARKGDV